MTYRRRSPVAAAIVLPVAFGGLLLIGVIAVAAQLRGTPVLVLAGVLVAATSFVAEPLVALPLAVIGWFAEAGFDRTPYGDLHADGAVRAAVVLALTAAAAACAGTARRGTLEAVNRRGAISPRRLVAGLGLAAVLLPALTAVLAALRGHPALVDDLLLYLVVVLAVTIVGGFWPAVLAAVAAGLLLNWFFTPPENMLALLLFVTVAVTVSSVVHLAARRSALAAERAREASTLLALARTVIA